MSTLTCQALEHLTAMRNRESLNPNWGTILAAEIFYVAIIPFSIVESAFALISTIFLWMLLPMIILIAPESVDSEPAEVMRISKQFIKDFSLSILWATSSMMMNLFSASPLSTETEAEQYFGCY